MLTTGVQEAILPYFQPIICVDSNSVFAYEVLGRKYKNSEIESLGSFFHDPEISPDEKLLVDRKVRCQAMKKVEDLPSNTCLFLNIQPSWLFPFINNARLFPTLECLEKFNISGKQIVIEIIEDEFCADISLLQELVHRYREAGCKIAIDDFGEGFSNLERIAVLCPDFLKISASLIERSQQGRIGYNVLESMGLLCEKSGASLVLEEVESMDHFLMGLEAGVRYFQGYLFAQPNPDFIPPGSFAGLVDRALASFLDKKITLKQKQIESSDKMNQYISQVLKEPFESSRMNPEYCIVRLIFEAPSEWFRAYVCNGRGYQVTPNFIKIGNERWHMQPEYLGRNWCWRPYFLPRMLDTSNRGEGMLSTSYLDLETRRQISTFVYPLDSDLFLFVDCQSNTK
ncbi:MAG: EAL domain-containing protein [Syntrophomonadaceae bacterium]|nr:EAL domain-containing protein [Syntrophomonadaceae bacterium]